MSDTDTASPTPERLAYRVIEVAEAIGISRARVFQLIAAGELKAVKLGACTLIRRETLIEYLDSLPEAG